MTAPSAPELSHREIVTALSGVLTGMFVAILSNTIVANALPSMVADLQGSQTGYTWVVTATLLATTASTPIWGKLADLFPKKPLVQAAVVIFILTSVGAGLAGSMGSLIAWRFGQGIGAGGLMALAQVVIAAIIPPRQRGRYSGYLGAVLATATVSGPLVGGLLVDAPGLGWRACFFAGVPVGLAALLVMQKTLRLPHVSRPVKLDYWGATLIVGGVSTLLIWISLAGKQFDWLSVTSGVLVGLGVLALAVAVLVETRVSEPVVPMWLFRERTVLLSVLGSMVAGVVMFGSSVFLGQYFQIGRAYSPMAAGLLTLPLIAGLVASSTITGRLISRYGRWKPYLVGGALSVTAGLALLGTIDHTTPIWLVGAYLVLLGTGMGATMQNLVLAVQNTVDVTDIGSASSLVAFLRSLGGTVGVTLLGVLLDGRVAALLGGSSGALESLATADAAQAAAVRAAYGDAMAFIFLIAAIASVLTVVCVLLIREVPLRTTVAKAVAPAQSPDDARTVEHAKAA